MAFEKEYAFIDKVLEVLKEDPNADDHIRDYPYTKEYLTEMLMGESQFSLLGGLINAMERYLEK